MRVLLVLLCHLAGCSGCDVPADFTPKPHQDAAERLIWTEFLGSHREPPHIGWREPECGSSESFSDGFTVPHLGFSYDGECYAGLERDGTVVITWVGAFWRSVLPHELMHVKFADDLGDGDGEHARPEWRSWPRMLEIELQAAGL
jgi:hypothetical protein